MPMRRGQKINQEYQFLEYIYAERIPVTHNCSKCGNRMVHIISYFTHSAYLCRKCDYIEIK